MVSEMVDEMLRPQPGRQPVAPVTGLLNCCSMPIVINTWAGSFPMIVSRFFIPRHRAVRYLNENYQKPLTLPEVAGMFRISPHYLSRLFKQTTGFSFSDYLNLLRVKEAQRLLRESEESITDIAWLAGFSNFSHFGKMFKRTVQVSPRVYRTGIQGIGFREDHKRGREYTMIEARLNELGDHLPTASAPQRNTPMPLL